MRKYLLGLSVSVAALLSLSSVFAFSTPFSPTAYLDINYSIGDTNTSFIFDAGRSVNHLGLNSGLEYRFNFEYGDTDFTEWSTYPRATYKYPDKGNKMIFLEVKDSEGRIDRTTSQVLVSDAVPVKADFSVDKTSGDLNTNFNFYATVFTQAGESPRKYRFRWDFDGDSIFDTQFSDIAVASHTYTTSGTKTPKLEVRDETDNNIIIVGYRSETNEIGKIEVKSSRTPEAGIQVIPKFGETDRTTFYIDASLSNDEYGRSDYQVRFDFENDGNYDTDFSDEKKATHIFNTPGDKSILVQIRSASGKTDTAIYTINVSDKSSKPYADLQITNDSSSGDPYAGTINTTFTFNANGSKDLEDGSADLEARFDFDGDGKYDTIYTKNKIVKHIYFSAGEKKAIVQVKDTHGNTATDSKNITVVSNDPPTVMLSAKPISGTPGTTFNFDTTGSEDSQNQNMFLQSRIDYEGDGIYDTGFSNVRFYSHIYKTQGSYKPKVQIKDKFGNSAEKSTSIIVFLSTKPVPFFTVSPHEGTFITNFSFNASDSQDAETILKNLKFRWDFNYTGANDIVYDTGFLFNPITYRTFKGETGERRIRLEVEDEDGNRSSVVKSINLHWASPYLEKLYYRGIMRGDSKGDFTPDRYVTRAELIKMVVMAAGLQSGYATYTESFTDVKKEDWFASYVQTAKDKGLIVGYSDGRFMPARNVNRAEALKIILLAFNQQLIHNCSNIFGDIKDDDWYARYVCTGYRLEVIQGYADKNFHAERAMTRAEAAKVISLLMN